MTEFYLVMGYEFISSWPVRAFLDEGDAREFRDRLEARFAALQVPEESDRVEACTRLRALSASGSRPAPAFALSRL